MKPSSAQAGRPFTRRSAISNALLGNPVAARQQASEALELSSGRDVSYAAAFAFASIGDTPRAQELASGLAMKYPQDTSVQFNYLPALRGLFALNQKDPQKATEILQAALPNELGIPAVAFISYYGHFYPAYVRGQAYLALNRGADATAEFQKILQHRGLLKTDPLSAMARLQLARALVMSGDAAKAKDAYRDLLAVWKDADANLTVLQRAKAEYARLQ